MLKDIAFIASILIEIAAPLIIASYFAKKFKISWKIFFLGMALFILSMIRIPLNNILGQFARVNFLGENLILISIIFPSLTASIFEEGLRTLGIGLIIKNKTFEKGLMYGIGHGGGGEAMLLVGISGAVNFVAYKFFTFLPQLAPLKAQFDSMLWYMPLVGASERLMAIVIQLAFSVLIMSAFIYRRYYLIAIAFLMHFIVDFIAVYVNIKFGVLWSELTVFLFMLISLLLIFIFNAKSKKAKILKNDYLLQKEI